VLAVGDQAFQEKSLRRVEEVLGKGTTIVFVSHSVDVVREVCQRAFLLSHGQLLSVGTASEVTRDYLDRVQKQQLEARLSPYEVEAVPAWKRALALAALLALGASVLAAGARYVLSADLPSARPLSGKTIK
jgi:ABC-type methionine transport system ATPase subunit